MFQKLNIKSGRKILELGCGNGLLWKEFINKLPENLDILLTDYSEGMLIILKIFRFIKIMI
ncbi:MAG: hypothetical protein ACERKZ_07320 [Lachnotalea sp.]